MNYSLAMHLLANGLINKNMRGIVEETLKGVRVSNSEIMKAKETTDVGSYKVATLETVNGDNLKINTDNKECTIALENATLEEEFTFNAKEPIPKISGHIILVTEDGGRMIIEKPEDSTTKVVYYDKDSVEHLEKTWEKDEIGVLLTNKYNEEDFEELGLLPDKQIELQNTDAEFLDMCKMAISDKQALEKSMLEILSKESKTR